MATVTANIHDEARRLNGLDPTSFKTEVNADLRPEAHGAQSRIRHEALRSPAVVDRWFTTLSQIAKSVDGQLAAKIEDNQATKAALRAEIIGLEEGGLTEDGKSLKDLQRDLEVLASKYARARAGTLRFKTGLDETLIEARALRDSLRDRLYDTVVADERNRYAARVKVLEEGIAAHQQAADLAGLDPEAHDEMLWRLQ